jgi:hypothetical protein
LGYTSITGSPPTASGYWDTSDSAVPAGVVLVNPTNTPLWIDWTLPIAAGYGLAVSPGLPTNAAAGYGYSPGPYNGINSFVQLTAFNGPNQPVTNNQAGSNLWMLIPADCLPSYGMSGVTNAFFELVNPPVPAPIEE